MGKFCLILVLLTLLSGCFAYIEEKKESVSVKSYGIMTSKEALDLFEKSQAKSPDEKHEIRFFRGQ